MKNSLLPKVQNAIQLIDNQVDVGKIVREYESSASKYNVSWSLKFLKNFNKVKTFETQAIETRSDLYQASNYKFKAAMVMEPLIDFAKETTKARRDCSSSVDQTFPTASPLKLTLKLPKPTSNLDIRISDSPCNLRKSGSIGSNSGNSDYNS